MVSPPLTKYMFCSPAEGAVALVLCRADIAHRFTDAAGPAALVRHAHPALRHVRGVQPVAGPRAGRRSDRARGPRPRSSRPASSPGDVDVAQIQDTESGAELMHMAETGLCEHGEQERADPQPADRDRRPAADQHRRRLPRQRRADRRVRAAPGARERAAAARRRRRPPGARASPRWPSPTSTARPASAPARCCRR